jgi:hypothetical protein
MKVIHETLRVHRNVISTFVYVILVSVKVVIWIKPILYTFFAHYFALPSNTMDWNPINQYHATTFLCMSLTPVIIFRLVAVLLAPFSVFKMTLKLKERMGWLDMYLPMSLFFI